MVKDPLSIQPLKCLKSKPKNRNIVCVAQSRSGTGSICQLFAKLGVDSYHEIGAYPQQIYDRIKEVFAKNRPSFILDNVGSFYLFSRIENEFPDTRFFVLIRDPAACCNSQRHTVRLINPRFTSDFNHYVDGWIMTYFNLCHHIEMMRNKPQLIEFEKYINGDYNNILLNTYGIPDGEQIRSELSRHLSTKINTNDEYAMTDSIDGKRYKFCVEIKDRLADLCRDSWIKEIS